MSEQAKALALTYGDCLTAAEHLQKSNFYSDCRTVSQAVAKILAGRELGIPPVASLCGIQIIQGRPQLSAVTMAALVKRSGRYDYRIRKHSEEACEILFRERCGDRWEEIGVSIFTMADARKAGSKNLDKFPRNMLFARAMSNGVRWFCPDIFLGPVYVEGEIESDGPFESPDAVTDLPQKPTSEAAPAEEPATQESDDSSLPATPELLAHLRKDLSRVKRDEAGLLRWLAKSEGATLEQLSCGEVRRALAVLAPKSRSAPAANGSTQ
jgi:hypothetical protein